MLNSVVDELNELDESVGGHITLGRDVHQEVHELGIHTNLGDCLQELLLALFVHAVIHEVLRGNVLEECDGVVVVTLILAPEINSVNQADVSFLWLLDVNQATQNLKGVWLRELLKNKCSLLLVLS